MFVLVQDACLEQTVDLGIYDIFLLHLFSHGSVLFLQVVVPLQLCLDYCFLLPGGFPVGDDLLLAPSALGVFLHKEDGGSMVNCKKRRISEMKR